MHKRVNGVLVAQNGQQTFNALLDLELNPKKVNEEQVPVGWILVKRTIAPGHKVPKGNYTLQPHEHHPEPSQIRIEGQDMRPGWL